MQAKEIENEKLRFKIVQVGENVIGLTAHDKLQSELNIANSQIKFKTGKIESQRLEIEQLSLLVRELYQKVQATEQVSRTRAAELEAYVDAHLHSMAKRAGKVKRTLEDTLLYSGKTHCVEMLNKKEREAALLRGKVNQLERRLKLLEVQKMTPEELAQRLLEEANQMESEASAESHIKLPAQRSPISIVAFERNEDLRVQTLHLAQEPQ